jgi:hypothetical protein
MLMEYGRQHGKNKPTLHSIPQNRSSLYFIPRLFEIKTSIQVHFLKIISEKSTKYCYSLPL